KPQATAGGRDIFRRVSLASRIGGTAEQRSIGAELFPREARTDAFHPEPGCSAPTFVGSASQVAALAGSLLDAGLAIMKESDSLADFGAVLTSLPSRPDGSLSAKLEWRNDVSVRDATHGYQVRISPRAVSVMRAEVARGLRLR